MAKKELFSTFTKQLKEPLLILFLVVSASVWYLNRLNELAQKDVTIPLVVLGVENPMQSNNERYFAVYARVKARGYQLLFGSLFQSALKIEIDITDILSQDNNGGDVLTLDGAKLESVIANKLGDIELVKLYDSRLELNDISYSAKKVKVYSRLSFDMSDGAVYVEDLKFDPEYVTIKGATALIAEIDSISTISESVNVNSTRKFSNVRLQSLRGVQVTPSHVSYTLSSARVYEQKVVTVARLIFPPGDTTLKQSDFITIPDHVEVVLDVATIDDAKFDNSDISATVLYDFDKDNGNYIGDNKFRVEIDGLPKGVVLRYVEPMHVTLLRKQR